VKGFKSKLPYLLLSLTLLTTSCSVQKVEPRTSVEEEVVEELPEILTEKIDYYRALDQLRKENCKPEITKATRGLVGWSASMWAPTGVHVYNYPEDLMKFGDSLAYGNAIEDALIVSLAYMQKLASLYSNVHGIYREELSSYRGTYDKFLNMALNASNKLCNLEPAGYKFLGYTTDDFGDRVRVPELDINCVNLDSKELIKTIKIEDGVSFYCLRDNSLSAKQKAMVEPILQNLIENWESMSSFVRATEYASEKISQDIASSLEEDLPNCVEYPTDNPKYKIVKCTNLP
jgi:hypothetical protein